MGFIDLIHCRVWVRDGFAVHDLGDSKLNGVAPVREVDKDAARVGDGHAGRHRAIKAGDRFRLLGGGGQSRQAGKKCNSSFEHSLGEDNRHWKRRFRKVFYSH